LNLRRTVTLAVEGLCLRVQNGNRMSEGLYINAMRDAEAGIFFVESNVPGLNVEADTIEEMIEILVDVVPELIKANVGRVDGKLPHVRFSADLAFA